ncbi:MAG TPA: hypothetical protein VM098_01055 [Phycisphaerae bacterium]|nr:hypothetical protein [Phycisphaerae bacterium]
MKDECEQHDLDDLSAWLDGELEDDRARQIERAVAADPGLGEACSELRRLNEMLNTLTTPAASEGLAERIAARARRAGQRPAAVIRTLRWLVPVAAAAAVVIAVGLHRYWRPSQAARPEPSAVGAEKPGGTKGAAQGPLAENLNAPQRAPAGVANMGSDKTASARTVANVSLFADFFVLENYDTLEAIEQLESRARGT